MAKKGIDEWSLGYLITKIICGFVFNNFYKKIQAVNQHRIKKNQPVILAPNHQNALMDALSVLFNIPYQPVFLARSDIFKGALVIKILTFLKILPVYRIRDGADKVKKNEEIFQQTLQILKNKHNPLCLMPEGNHGDKRRLRNLVKGIFRIAFMAQKEYGSNPGVKIIPVGLDYKDYQKFGQTLFVNYGEPIEVCEYYEEFEKSEPVAINQLKERLAEELKKQMIHIENEEYYDLYMSLRTVYNNNMLNHLEIKERTLYDKFKADKEMIRILDKTTNDEEIDILNQQMDIYNKVLKKYNFRDWVFKKPNYSVFGLLMGFILLAIGTPFYVLGLINNYVPYKIPTRFVKNIKDAQFHSSFKYVISVITFLVYYTLLVAIALIFLESWWLKLAYLAVIYPSGVFAFKYYIFAKKWYAKIRYNIRTWKKNREVKEAYLTRTDIIKKMDKIVLRALNKN